MGLRRGVRPGAARGERERHVRGDRRERGGGERRCHDERRAEYDRGPDPVDSPRLFGSFSGDLVGPFEATHYALNDGYLFACE